MADQSPLGQQAEQPTIETREEFDENENAGAELLNSFMGIQARFGQTNLIDKIEPAQLTAIIANADIQNKRDHERITFGIKMFVFVVISVLVLIFGLCWLFLSYQKGDLLREIIALLVGLAGGGGIGGVGGYGLAKSLGKNQD